MSRSIISRMTASMSNRPGRRIIFRRRSGESWSLAQKIGCSQVITILENIRFLGYEVAMSRLVGGKPIIEVDKEVGDNRPGMQPPALPASRYACLAPIRDRVKLRGRLDRVEQPRTRLQNCLR